MSCNIRDFRYISQGLIFKMEDGISARYYHHLASMSGWGRNLIWLCKVNGGHWLDSVSYITDTVNLTLSFSPNLSSLQDIITFYNLGLFKQQLVCGIPLCVCQE